VLNSWKPGVTPYAHRGDRATKPKNARAISRVTVPELSGAPGPLMRAVRIVT